MCVCVCGVCALCSESAAPIEVASVSLMNLQAQWQEWGPKILFVCVGGWLMRSRKQLKDLCVCDILCGQWGWGGCKMAIALASVVLQLIYWTARHKGGQGEASSSQGARPSNLQHTRLCVLLLVFLHQCRTELRWYDPRKPDLLFSILPVCHLR